MSSKPKTNEIIYGYTRRDLDGHKVTGDGCISTSSTKAKDIYEEIKEDVLSKTDYSMQIVITFVTVL